MLEKTPSLKLQDLVEVLKETHKYRRHAMKLQQKIDRSTESFVRVNCTEWSPDLPEEEREKINKQALEIVKQARAGNGLPRIVKLVRDSDLARSHADKMREEAQGEMETIAAQLPVYAWVKQQHGAGALGLATIVAEAGDLANYSVPCKLWKRLGYAPYQGHAGSTWKREKWRPRALTAEEWIANPFSGKRYALIHQIGTWLINAQVVSAEKSGTPFGAPTGLYGKIYIERREKTKLEHPDWTKGHGRNDGIRITTKAFLKDLWNTWNLPADHLRNDLHKAFVGGGARADQLNDELQNAPVQPRPIKSKRSADHPVNELQGQGVGGGAREDRSKVDLRLTNVQPRPTSSVEARPLVLDGDGVDPILSEANAKKLKKAVKKNTTKAQRKAAKTIA